MYLLASSAADYRRQTEMLHQVAHTDTSKWAEQADNGGRSAPVAIAALAEIHFAKAAAALLGLDTAEFQRQCYLAAKLTIMAGVEHNGEAQPFRLNNLNDVKVLFGALYAPNDELRYFLVRHREQIADTGVKFSGSHAEPYLANSMVLALSPENKETLLQRCDAVLMKPATQAMKKRLPEFAFLAALAQGDAQAMAEALQPLLALPLARQAAKGKLPFFDYFLQPQVLNCMRLAYLNGYDVDLSSNIAPKLLSRLNNEETVEQPYAVMKDFDLNQPFTFQYVWLEKWLG